MNSYSTFKVCGRRIRGSATDGNTNASIAILGVLAGDQACCRRRYCELLTGLANGPTYYFGITGSAPGWGADGLSLRGSTPGVVRPPPWQDACLLLAQFITPSTRTPGIFSLCLQFQFLARTQKSVKMSTASSRASSTSTAPVPTVTALNGWKYMGCYHDQEGSIRGSNRLLGNATVTFSNLQITGCQNYCSSGAVGAPYPYFGVETGTECWCGSSLNLNDINVKSDEANCDQACTGQPKQLCGGEWYINVYSASSISTRTGPQATGSVTTIPGDAGSAGSSTSSSSSSTGTGNGNTGSGSSGGASAGTIAAAVIAGLLGLALLLVGCLWLLNRRKRKAKAELPGSTVPGDPYYAPNMPPMAGHGDPGVYAKHAQTPPAFLDSQPISELPSRA